MNSSKSFPVAVIPALVAALAAIAALVVSGWPATISLVLSIVAAFISAGVAWATHSTVDFAGRINELEVALQAAGQEAERLRRQQENSVVAANQLNSSEDSRELAGLRDSISQSTQLS